MDDVPRPSADRRPELLRTALLLTGDRASAEELVQRALTRVRGRSGDPGSAELAALVRLATSRWARLGRAEQVIEELPDPFRPSAAPDPGPDLARALRELPARTRAVVVLRWHGHLPDARIAELLRCPVPEVAAEAARGLALLAPALQPSAFERAAPDVPAEQRLADQLVRLARAPGSWRLDADAAVADVRARRAGARRRLAGAAVAVLAVVGVAVPLARWAPDPVPTTATPSATPVAARPTPPVPGVPVLAGPTRGSLAGDPVFLDALRSVGWGAQEAPPPADREVVFAADTPHGRVALVVGTVLEDFRGVWLTGPVGAAAADLVPHLPVQLGRERPLALLLGGPGDAEARGRGRARRRGRGVRPADDRPARHGRPHLHPGRRRGRGGRGAGPDHHGRLRGQRPGRAGRPGGLPLGRGLAGRRRGAARTGGRAGPAPPGDTAERRAPGGRRAPRPRRAARDRAGRAAAGPALVGRGAPEPRHRTGGGAGRVQPRRGAGGDHLGRGGPRRGLLRRADTARGHRRRHPDRRPDLRRRPPRPRPDRRRPLAGGHRSPGRRLGAAAGRPRSGARAAPADRRRHGGADDRRRPLGAHPGRGRPAAGRDADRPGAHRAVRRLRARPGPLRAQKAGPVRQGICCRVSVLPSGSSSAAYSTPPPTSVTSPTSTPRPTSSARAAAMSATTRCRPRTDPGAAS
ncbi:protein of unknown function [Modestobacter italicus]|uniref:Uncharacterized protein n=1 Tax=Modestobacter italicus (strain DSM 44449 / CECT 9708 / BC 501) TaxID=2732864 RepID=I4EW96_MODI5|nr:protein of unknown function [Modestobacter marinus]